MDIVTSETIIECLAEKVKTLTYLTDYLRGEKDKAEKELGGLKEKYDALMADYRTLKDKYEF